MPSRALRTGIVSAGALAAIAVLASGLGVSIGYVVVVLAGIVVLNSWRATARHAGSRTYRRRPAPRRDAIDGSAFATWVESSSLRPRARAMS